MGSLQLLQNRMRNAAFRAFQNKMNLDNRFAAAKNPFDGRAGAESDRMSKQIKRTGKKTGKENNSEANQQSLSTITDETKANPPREDLPRYSGQKQRFKFILSSD